MKHFIETKVIHHTKSDLLIDIIQHESGKNYLEIIQTFHDEKPNTSIKVNPIILKLPKRYKYRRFISFDEQKQEIY